ncbi:MAG: HAD hydrolase family protein [Candidatus Hodarchaeales archaeon]|jgi:3-deoxy-D-manno-octulosonate 8-phosphate phosphatase (KDO 8-P phosphatase)
MIKLVILDIDGVLTDGRKYYGLDGIPFAKTYCDKDFTAIKRLRGAGVKVCFLSGDERVNKAMAINRNIDFYSARGKDKADFITEFQKTYKTEKEDMLYIGDDLFDKSIMEIVGHAYCPNDACHDVKLVCGLENILSRNGGNNVVAEMVEKLLERHLIPDCTMEDIERLDKNEKF